MKGLMKREVVFAAAETVASMTSHLETPSSMTSHLDSPSPNTPHLESPAAPNTPHLESSNISTGSNRKQSSAGESDSNQSTPQRKTVVNFVKKSVRIATTTTSSELNFADDEPVQIDHHSLEAIANKYDLQTNIAINV